MLSYERAIRRAYHRGLACRCHELGKLWVLVRGMPSELVLALRYRIGTSLHVIFALNADRLHVCSETKRPYAGWDVAVAVADRCWARGLRHISGSRVAVAAADGQIRGSNVFNTALVPPSSHITCAFRLLFVLSKGSENERTNSTRKIAMRKTRKQTPLRIKAPERQTQSNNVPAQNRSS